jgi:hypothetical protein
VSAPTPPWLIGVRIAKSGWCISSTISRPWAPAQIREEIRQREELHGRAVVGPNAHEPLRRVHRATRANLPPPQRHLPVCGALVELRQVDARDGLLEIGGGHGARRMCARHVPFIARLLIERLAVEFAHVPGHASPRLFVLGKGPLEEAASPCRTRS